MLRKMSGSSACSEQAIRRETARHLEDELEGGPGAILMEAVFVDAVLWDEGPASRNCAWVTSSSAAAASFSLRPRHARGWLWLVGLRT